MTSLNH